MYCSILRKPCQIYFHVTYGKHFHSTGVSEDKVLFFSPKFLKRRKVVVLFAKNVKKSSLKSIGYKVIFGDFLSFL